MSKGDPLFQESQTFPSNTDPLFVFSMLEVTRTETQLESNLNRNQKDKIRVVSHFF